MTDQPIMRHVIAALVANEPGVLARVAGMFAARGFNIDSLVVGRTENPEISRMTIVVNGTMDTLDQVRKQLGRLVEVIKVADYLDTDTVERDLMLIRINAPANERTEVLQVVEMFRAQVVDVGLQELMIELSGNIDKLEAFADLLQPYGVVELARTGVIAMPRSEKELGKKPTPRAQRILTNQDPSAASAIDPTTLPPG